MKVIAVSAARRTRAAVSYFLKIVRTLLAAGRDYFLSGNVVGQFFHISRNIESDPMNPSLAGSVRVVCDEREALCLFRDASPCKRRRRVRAVASIFFRNHPAILKSLARNFNLSLLLTLPG